MPTPATGELGQPLKGTFYHSDEYCPHCDNHFVIDAKTPQASLQVEGDDVRMDARCVSTFLFLLVSVCY